MEDQTTDRCFEFDTKTYQRRDIARLGLRREAPACVEFEGRIVVTGGMDYIDGELEVYDTAEMYDHTTDSWSDFPSMIHPRRRHQSVSNRNKLFVVGGGGVYETCEVYDSTSKIFIALKPFKPLRRLLTFYTNLSTAIIIANEVYIFGSYSKQVLCYNLENDEWTEKLCPLLRKLENFYCVKIPQINF